ncbi:glycoside hydrolase family 19 protein [Nocardia wallacei]|uniref:glycoside hydrolase family 19 protein n=1 Tax=Nocardia wallacei TaxID=480035 RepID=UPI0024568133|nr:glycoside hydrolase family 19 protein [Nocardia wallacei]
MIPPRSVVASWRALEAADLLCAEFDRHIEDLETLSATVRDSCHRLDGDGWQGQAYDAVLAHVDAAHRRHQRLCEQAELLRDAGARALSELHYTALALLDYVADAEAAGCRIADNWAVTTGAAAQEWAEVIAEAVAAVERADECGRTAIGAITTEIGHLATSFDLPGMLLTGLNALITPVPACPDTGHPGPPPPEPTVPSQHWGDPTPTPQESTDPHSPSECDCPETTDEDSTSQDKATSQDKGSAQASEECTGEGDSGEEGSSRKSGEENSPQVSDEGPRISGEGEDPGESEDEGGSQADEGGQAELGEEGESDGVEPVMPSQGGDEVGITETSAAAMVPSDEPQPLAAPTLPGGAQSPGMAAVPEGGQPAMPGVPDGSPTSVMPIPQGGGVSLPASTIPVAAVEQHDQLETGSAAGVFIPELTAVIDPPPGGVDADQLVAIMPDLSPDLAGEYLPALNAAMQEGDITTPPRQAAFLAQLAHESCQLRYFEELGDDEYFSQYDPGQANTAAGNTEPGDGPRYHGRGPIQLTGRANYREAGAALGLDLETTPELAAQPDIGFRIAQWYWTSRNINALADADDFAAVTRAVNGGYNGLSARQEYYARALEVLG